MIHLLEISKAYVSKSGEHTVVLRPTTLSIPTDRRIGILGEPGCGKSTLLKLISGEEAPSEGHVTADARLSPVLGRPGLLNLRLTGLENAAYLARLYGLPVEPVLDQVAMVSGLDEELSKQVRRIAPAARNWLLLCIISALDVDCVLADGILAGQNPQYAQRAQRMILDGHVAKGLIFASGGPNAIRSLCEHLVVIKEGTLWPFDDVQEGIQFFKSGLGK